MENFFGKKHLFGGKVALGIMFSAVLVELAIKGYQTGQWLAVFVHRP